VKDPTFHTESIKAQKQNYGDFAFNENYLPIFKALKFMTSSSLLLALNGMMVVVFGFFLYSSKIVPSLLLAAFLVTFAVYGLNKVTDKSEDSINRPETSSSSSGYFLTFSIVSMLIGFLIGLDQGVMAFMILFTPVIIGVIYSVKISKSVPRLKEIVGIKSLVVAVSWALTGCFLPEVDFVMKFQASLIIFIYIFVRIFVGTILCDVLDSKGDLSSGIETIPTRLGRNKTKKLLIVMNSLGILLLVYCQLMGIFVRFLPALLFGVLYGYFAIWFFFRDNCKRFTGGLILDVEWFPIVIILCLLIK
jgi:4-hydroxybenzoate polyprenyltransferase